jgi:hypothetical protein
MMKMTIRIRIFIIPINGPTTEASKLSKFYYLFTNEDLSIINIFGNCIIEYLETRKLKQGL